jgi:hypothetical protein
VFTRLLEKDDDPGGKQAGHLVSIKKNLAFTRTTRTTPENLENSSGFCSKVPLGLPGPPSLAARTRAVAWDYLVGRRESGRFRTRFCQRDWFWGW